MKISRLIELHHRYDFGHDWYVQILNIKRFSLLQVSISWTDYPSWPYLQIKSGTGDLLSILFWAYRFGIDIDFMGRTWRWDYMDELPEEFDNVTMEDDCMPPWGHSDLEYHSKNKDNV